MEICIYLFTTTHTHKRERKKACFGHVHACVKGNHQQRFNFSTNHETRETTPWMRSFTREWKKMSKRNLMGKIKAFAHIRGIRLAVELVHHYFYSSSSYTSSSSSRSLFSALQVNKTWLKLLSVRFCITNFFCSNDFPIWKNYIYFLLICLHYYEMFSSNLTSRMYVDFPRLFFTLVCKKKWFWISPAIFCELWTG